MKDKSDWFDDNWNWDVRPTRVLYELLLSPSYRIPMRVKEVCSFKLSGVRIFQSVHVVEPLWNVNTSSFVTAAVNV